MTSTSPQYWADGFLLYSFFSFLSVEAKRYFNSRPGSGWKVNRESRIPAWQLNIVWSEFCHSYDHVLMLISANMDPKIRSQRYFNSAIILNIAGMALTQISSANFHLACLHNNARSRPRVETPTRSCEPKEFPLLDVGHGRGDESVLRPVGDLARHGWPFWRHWETSQLVLKRTQSHSAGEDLGLPGMEELVEEGQRRGSERVLQHLGDWGWSKLPSASRILERDLG